MQRQGVHMTTWTINGRFLSQPVTGVQRYAHEITQAIDDLIGRDASAQDRPVIEILVPPGTVKIPAYRNISVRQVGRFRGHLWEQLDLPVNAKGPLLSLANTGPVLKSRQIVCIHDANTRVIPESYSLAFRAAYRVLHPALGRMAHQITTVSRHAANDLVRFRIAPRSKLSVAYNGADHASRWTPRHTPATAIAASPATIVLLGSQAPHKNIDLILGLAPQLASEGFRIAVVGLAASIFAARHGPAIHPSVHFLGRVNDDALAALLRDSLCLAFPSLTEGFGLPPLEAMIHGCPVVASTAASIPEVCGDAAYYADPHDSAAWLSAFRALRSDTSLRQSLSTRGRARANQFTWARTADLYVTELRSIASPPVKSATQSTVNPPIAAVPPARTFRD